MKIRNAPYYLWWIFFLIGGIWLIIMLIVFPHTFAWQYIYNGMLLGTIEWLILLILSVIAHKCSDKNIFRWATRLQSMVAWLWLRFTPYIHMLLPFPHSYTRSIALVIFALLGATTEYLYSTYFKESNAT